MSAAHTPGPWLYSEKDADLNPCAYVEAADCSGFVVAHTTRIEMGHRLRGVTGEQMANARLIAAAPEMFAMLQKLLHAGTWFLSALELDHDQDGEKLEADIESILAKATGAPT